ncbi:MAG: 23S rRNA (guanosine(2251)-2'-O)-methyltransferase RlmB [Truepera sp.]|jgi:23S rRNA (guanosine2251-2'-O)-methyltransferase|nr:23S rRNA (guanosine(2251)-2'-O)-methyltransferase RlmB [Truepera sp.]
MWIYGRNAVLEALRDSTVERVAVAKGVQPGILKELRRATAAADVPLDEVPRIQLDQALKTTQHQGVAALMPEVTTAPLEAAFERAESRDEQLLLVLLDHLTDPRNVGAIIRSAEALGAHGVVMEERRSAPLSAVVVKAAAGATAHLPLIVVTNLPRTIEDLKERGVWVYGADGAATATPADIDWERKVALVIGSEGDGMRRLVRERCDELVAVPLSGRITSLNASVAAGILLFAAVTARARANAPAGGAER